MACVLSLNIQPVQSISTYAIYMYISIYLYSLVQFDAIFIRNCFLLL